MTLFVGRSAPRSLYDSVSEASSAIVIREYSSSFGLASRLLGALFQAGYYCPECRRDSEGARHVCGAISMHARGLSWFDNDGVNLVATLGGALLSALVVLALT